MLGPLVVDLDGVLRIWDPTILADAERLNGLPCGSIASAAFSDSERLHRAVTGAITDEQWRQEIVFELEASYGGAAALAAVAQWSASAGRVNEAVLAILRQERRRRPVALFSNATTRLEADLHRLGLMDELDVVFNSSSLGRAKPAQEAFSAVLDALGASPAECLFVDDTAVNVQAADVAGIKAHRYTNPESLERFISRNTRPLL